MSGPQLQRRKPTDLGRTCHLKSKAVSLSVAIGIFLSSFILVSPHFHLNFFSTTDPVSPSFKCSCKGCTLNIRSDLKPNLGACFFKFMQLMNYNILI